MAQRDQIEAIRERLDIVQVIGGYTELKKKGQRFVGLCPFHSEKSPSFSVSPDKGLFYCFGCHEGGDAFAFVMRHDGVDFLEAARRLGEKVGVPLSPESQERAAQRKAEDDLARVNQFAHSFFCRALGEPTGAAARAYLSSRGVPGPLAQEWRLGYGGRPGELLRYLEQRKVPKELIERAGLLSDEGGRSLFEDRLIFPVFDTFGRLVGFGARRLAEHGPKYLNTRESPLFKKSKLLFGYEHAEGTIRRTRRVVIVEGYMDVIACHAAGVTGAVAALGTAFTEEHAEQVARFAKEAVVLMDADAAGQAASKKACEKLLVAAVTTQVATLPSGKDPDELVQKEGAEALRTVVEAAVPALEHFIGATFEGARGIEARAEAVKGLAPLFFAMPPGLARDLYLARLAAEVGIPEAQLEKHLKSALPLKKKTAPTPPPEKAAAPAAPKPTPPPVEKLKEIDRVELKMVEELLLYPELRPKLADLAEYAMDDAIRGALEALSQNENNLAEIVTKYFGQDRRAARLLSVTPAPADEEAAERAQRTYNDVLAQMRKRHVRAVKDELHKELALAQARGDDTTELLARIRDTDRRIRAM